jgi:hypothetical protein
MQPYVTGLTWLTLHDSNTVNLLEYYTSLNFNTVLLASEYYVKYPTETIGAENMMWMQECILNSCDYELKHYMMSQLSLLPLEQHGCPTVFMRMIERIVSNNDHLAWALISPLDVTIPMTTGENIENASAFIKNICNWLHTCQKLPPDIADIITTSWKHVQSNILNSTGKSWSQPEVQNYVPMMVFNMKW